MSEIKLGRPSKFTEARCQAILDAISKRIPYQLAAEANGICEDTLYEWINRGKADRDENINSDFAIFSESIKKIEMGKIQEHLDAIESMPKNWTAHAWILERRWWKWFGQKASEIEFDRRLTELEQKQNSKRYNGDQRNGKEMDPSDAHEKGRS